MNIWTEIGLVGQIALCLLMALFVYQLYFHIRYMAGIQRRFRHQRHKRFRWKDNGYGEGQDKGQSDEGQGTKGERQEAKGVSVVICAKNECDNLKDYLQAIMSQDYPLFEVIVVNDASEDNTGLVLEHYRHLYPNLRLTFVPSHAIVTSSKKLALTLAAKAARYDYLLLTDADCVPESDRWIKEMMEGFRNDRTEIVLGYSGYFPEKTFVNRFIQYETLTTAMLYLGSAMSLHPYMGVGRNLAYKKQTFFESGGFSRMLDQRAGDDDLLVNKLSNSRNTEVVASRDSIMWSVPKRTFAEWIVQKRRHLSVAPAYRTATKLRLAVEPVTRGLWYMLMIAVAAGAAMGLLHPAVAIAAGVLFAARLIVQIAVISRTANLLGTGGFGLSVIFFDIFIPLMQLCILIKSSVRKNKQLQWK